MGPDERSVVPLEQVGIALRSVGPADELVRAHAEVPLCHFQKLSLQRIQLLHLDTSDLGVVRIRAEHVALRFRPGTDPRDQESMYSE